MYICFNCCKMLNEEIFLSIFGNEAADILLKQEYKFYIFETYSN
jgi:hypothetical protein